MIRKEGHTTPWCRGVLTDIGSERASKYSSDNYLVNLSTGGVEESQRSPVPASATPKLLNHTCSAAPQPNSWKTAVSYEIIKPTTKLSFEKCHTKIWNSDFEDTIFDPDAVDKLFGGESY